MVIPGLQMSKLRHGKGKSLPQSHTGSDEWVWDLNPGNVALKTPLLTTMLILGLAWYVASLMTEDHSGPEYLQTAGLTQRLIWI